MSFLLRHNNIAYKNSINIKGLVFKNFLPIENTTVFDDCKQYIQRMINNNEIKDITSERAEKNGTLTLYNNNNMLTYKLYTNSIGYVRLIERGFKRDIYKILNMQLHVENNCFSERIFKVNSIDKQLLMIVKNIIFNK